MSEENNNWERGVLEKLAMSAVQEQRRARHWGIFFKVLTFGYLFILLFLFMGWVGKSDGLGRQTHGADRSEGRDLSGQYGKCRQSHWQSAGCVQGQEYGRA